MSKTILLAYLSCLVFGAQAQNTDARALVEKASEACKQVDYVEYNSKSEQRSLIVEAHIIQEEADVKDVGIGAAKLIAGGQFNMGEKVQPFRFSYDGHAFKLYEEGKGDLKRLSDPEPRSVGRLLGLYYYNAVSAYLIRPNGLDFLLQDEAEIQYVEEATVMNRPAHHIKVTRNLKRPGTDQVHKSESSWFLDAEHFLPVKRITGSIVSTIEYLSFQKPTDENNYDINHDHALHEVAITGNEPHTEGLPKPGTVLPEFELADKNGIHNRLSDVKGKVTLIDFWGTWCAPCLKAMPKLQALYDKYSPEGFKAIGISVADKPGKAERFLEGKSYTYQFLFQGDEYAKALKLNTFPTVFLIDEAGKVLHAEKGNRTGIEKTLEQIIKANLNSN